MGQPSSSDDRDREQAWTTYWHSGALHSCPTSFVGNYGGAIAEFWLAVARSLQPGMRILDLGTGNGPIPKLLVENAETPGLIEIDGVDAAQVAPAWHLSANAPNVRFHSGVRMERVPFPPATFDHVCSQFAIEYANAPAVWEETLRVLKYGGSLHWVMHHDASVFAKVAAQERDHLQWLLQPDGLLESAAALAPWLLRLRKGDSLVAMSGEANAIRQRFNFLQQEVEHRASTMPLPGVLEEVRATLHAILGKAMTPVEVLGDYRLQLEESRLRSGDLVDRALNDDDVGRLIGWLRDHRPNATVEAVVLRQQEGIVAWGVTLRDR